MYLDSSLRTRTFNRGQLEDYSRFALSLCADSVTYLNPLKCILIITCTVHAIQQTRALKSALHLRHISGPTHARIHCSKSHFGAELQSGLAHELQKRFAPLKVRCFHKAKGFRWQVAWNDRLAYNVKTLGQKCDSSHSLRCRVQPWAIRRLAAWLSG